MLVSKKDIFKYIPQRAPMIMVDALIACSKEEYISNFCPDSNNLFITRGFFNESGLVENMAQTAALGVGYYAVHTNKEVPLGFIGAIKNLKLIDQSRIDENLTTHIKILHEVLNATIAKAEVFCNNKLIAEGEFKIFINPLHEET